MTEADDLDRAADLTQASTDFAVSEQRRKAQPEQVRRHDGTWPVQVCVDCGDDLVIARLQMGRVRCVDCQGAIERGVHR